jgi:hypothetical protein
LILEFVNNTLSINVVISLAQDIGFPMLHLIIIIAQRKFLRKWFKYALGDVLYEVRLGRPALAGLQTGYSRTAQFWKKQCASGVTRLFVQLIPAGPDFSDWL